MNKTFKVVFNKARSALMVANEATSSVQKKTKLVVAIVSATAAMNVFSADTLWQIENQEKEISGWGGLIGLSQNEQIHANANVSGNVLTATGGSYGSVTSLYKATADIKDSKFNNNITSTALNSPNTSSEHATSVIGGVIMIKNGTTTLTDVEFNGNTITSTGTEKGAFVAGGAIYQDAVINTTDGTRPSALTINVSKNMEYVGNNVTSATPDVYYGLYGTASTSAGGFLFLDRNSHATFNVSEGATLKIGNESSSDNMDSIATAVVIDGDASNVSGFKKEGLGTLQINSELSKFYGVIDVNDGTLEVTKPWTLMNEVNVASQSSLIISNLKLGESPTKLTVDDKNGNAVTYEEGDGKLIVTHGKINSAGTVVAQTVDIGSENSINISNGTFTVNKTLHIANGGALSVSGGTLIIGESIQSDSNGSLSLTGGTLQTMVSNVFALSDDSGALISTDQNAQFIASADEVTGVNSALNLTSGTVALTDEGYYTNTSLRAMSSQLGDVSLVILNAQGLLEEGETSMDLVDGVIHSEAVGVDGKMTGQGDVTAAIDTTKASGGASLEVSYESSVGSAAPTSVTISSTNSSTIVLTGDAEGSALVTVKDSADPQAKPQEVETVVVSESVTLQLGNGVGASAETSGSIQNVVVQGALNLQNIAASVDTLSGTGTVNVGTAVAVENGSQTGYRATLKVAELDMDGGMIFVDPAWENENALADIAKASHLEISKIAGGVLDTKLVAGQNALITVGATTEQATAAFNSITAASTDVAGWGKEAVSSAIYLGERVTFGSTNGGILVDGSLSKAPALADVKAETLTVANGGMVMTDSSLLTDEAKPLIDGTLAYSGTTGNAYIGITNAGESTYYLATNVTGAESFKVVTDNPFISGSLTAEGTVQTAVDAEGGLSAISSTGLQAMTRRADTVLAQTIADRTSVDQELKAGLNLWVDVTGENYESDDFDNGGEFTADMGYGTFGGDIGFGNFTVGGAFQYGTGSLRSSVSNIKNEIDNYGVSLYGTYKVTDAFKLAAELAYVWGENDISSSQTALNQSVDTEMYSFGLRAMYKLTAGNFSFVPSIGLRVSQLSTDEMKVGSVKVDDQDQTLVQVPIALRINAADFTAGGWVVAPSMKIAYVPTFGDKDIVVLHHTQDVIDTAPVQADFGLRVGKDNMLFNVNMLLGAGEYGTSAIGGKVGFKYVF